MQAVRSSDKARGPRTCEFNLRTNTETFHNAVTLQCVRVAPRALPQVAHSAGHAPETIAIGPCTPKLMNRAMQCAEFRSKFSPTE